MSTAAITVPTEACRDWTHAARLEWLETNGTGGFAMGTVSGANTRRYHALLVASLHPPVQRRLLLSRVEEELQIGTSYANLGAAQYPGIVSPQGFQLLKSFRLDPYPIWQYQLDQATLEKSFFLVHNQQTAVLRYTTDTPCRLRVRTFLANRDYHSLQHGHPGFDQGPLRLHHNGAAFIPDAHWYYQNEYMLEAERGMDFIEDLWSPGWIEWNLTPNSPPAFLAATIEPYDSIDANQVAAWDRSERARRTGALPTGFRTRLTQAADQFVVHRADRSPTLIAGYPWFTDWGRDTMIALPGLLLSRGLHTEAIEILDGFLRFLYRGLIPNRFPDAGEQPEYNTVDATLWAFIAAWELHRRGIAPAYLKERFYPAAQEILDWHRRGTDYGIAVDPTDSLLYAGAPNTQLTWMDAKVGDWVVTPRAGKPVEINALWYNALRITAALSPDPHPLNAEADQVRQSFESRFWNPTTACLYDVIDPNDDSIRPNQLLAVSLPFPLLEKTQQQSILKVVDQRLLTPYGLRTLDPQHPDYKGRYTGNQTERDGAYHQGTVWPWLLGPYISARLEAYGRTPENLTRCRNILTALEPELYRGCLGTLGEIHEADPPHRPAGAPAQAWSVAEVLRAMETLGWTDA
jgi:predicted glycogen debranching enzyme